jgi:hypothetical protein
VDDYPQQIGSAIRSSFQSIDDPEEAGLGHFGALAAARGGPQDDAVDSVLDNLDVVGVLAEPAVQDFLLLWRRLFHADFRQGDHSRLLGVEDGMD